MQCEKVKLTQTLSITFHLTRADDNVDTPDDAETRHQGSTAREGVKRVGVAVSRGFKHHKVGWVEGVCLVMSVSQWLLCLPETGE